MLKRLLLSLALVFLPSCAFAQSYALRNDSAATVQAGSNLIPTLISVTRYGEIYNRPFGAEFGDLYTAVSASDITDTTVTTVAAAGATGVRHYVTGWTVSNMSASVSTRVDLLDGATVIDTCPAAAGGGCAKAYTMPLRGTSATTLRCQAATTGAAVRCAVSGFNASR